MFLFSSAKEWNKGDTGITLNGEIVTVERIVGGRYIIIREDLEKKEYLPSHGEIIRLSEEACTT